MYIVEILLAIIISAALFFFYKKKAKKNGGSSSANAVSENPEMQAAYEQKKHPKDEHQSLSAEEKVELSWQFLTNIAEKVLGFFSRKDQEAVYESGQKLNKHGMIYQHDVNHEVKISLGESKAKNIKKSGKGAEKSR